MTDLTSNQYYGGLNRRFDKRAALLRRFGFAYEVVGQVAIFSRTRRCRRSEVPAALLSHADKRAWREALRSILCGVLVKGVK
jgi:hypothetical protein